MIFIQMQFIPPNSANLIGVTLSPAFGCAPERSGLREMCRYIPGDAALYSMFRVDGTPVAWDAIQWTI